MKNVMRKRSFTHVLGDSIERLGEKLTNVGAKKLGRKVYTFGNKIEHLHKKSEGGS